MRLVLNRLDCAKYRETGGLLCEWRNICSSLLEQPYILDREVPDCFMAGGLHKYVCFCVSLFS